MPTRARRRYRQDYLDSASSSSRRSKSPGRYFAPSTNIKTPVAEIVTNAGANTAAAGYILDENFETILSAAEEAQEADHYKRALSLYRKAYQHATIQSEELADSETP